MRRQIELYIGGMRADLNDDSFILMNYTMEDLSNPTIVKNSYSQQITLPGTPNNNLIFGHIYRFDRRFVPSDSGDMTGISFDPLRKTPFTIYMNGDQIYQSGYVKLDSIERNGKSISYKITLYGGLGSFFYSLSYNEDGDRLTLADLVYLDPENPETELDFTINSDAVREAWTRIGASAGGGVSTKWDVINFIPCYNGIPDGDFSPDMAIAKPESIGLPESSGEYTTHSGYTLIDLGKEHDEWAVKDLRSYLQRPGISVEAFIKAVCNPEYNGGFNVDVSDLVDADGIPLFRDMWITLPMLPEQTLSDNPYQMPMGFSQVRSDEVLAGIFEIQNKDEIPSGASVSADVAVRIRAQLPSDTGVKEYDSLWGHADINPNIYFSCTFVQLVALNSSGDVVGGSDVVCIFDKEVSWTVERILSGTNYSPRYNENVAYSRDSLIYTAKRYPTGELYAEADKSISLKAVGADAIRFEVDVHNYSLLRTGASNRWYDTDGNLSLWEVGTSLRSYCRQTYVASTGSLEATVNPVENARSNAYISKRTLLNTDSTPADYLLSLCKIFGFYFLYNDREKNIRIVTRNTLYQDDLIDLADRIDLASPVEIDPFSFNAKWYDLALEGDDGAFAEKYKALYGREYGLQRINTGYDFNKDTKNLLDGNDFRNAVALMESTSYFNTIMDPGYVPSVFVEKGCTYTLWNSAGDSQDFDIKPPGTDANISYYNEPYPGYDFFGAEKLQLHDKDNGSIDGSNIIVWYTGTVKYPYFKISDDSPTMNTLNGKPCWDLDPGSPDGVSVPAFSRYRQQARAVSESLDFGIPQEIGIPALLYQSGTIYERFWQDYLTDRYDANTRLMRCRVDLSGLDVGQDLLRKFFFYENSIWVLNSITNYSLTTYDFAECEFVQVIDKQNYLNSQHL